MTAFSDQLLTFLGAKDKLPNINLGQTYMQMKKYNKAISIYQKAILACKKSGSKMDLGFLYVLLAEVYFLKKDTNSYNEYIVLGERLVKENNNSNVEKP